MVAIPLLAVLIVSGIVIGFFVTIYNNLISTKHDVERAWANIDVLLKQRHDELPKLIKVVETYMTYEQDTLKKIIEARSRYTPAASFQEKNQLDQDLHKGLMSLFALAENYPDLKANAQFQELQKRIAHLEGSIADRREFYNASVNSWNIRLESIPDVILARLLNYQPRELFKASDIERADVEINIQLPSSERDRAGTKSS